MDRLTWTECFVRAVDTGSFSAVARAMRTSQPNVSRYIGALEKHLGARLFHRSTRSLRLTPEGERYYAAVRPAVDALAEADAHARGAAAPRGLLRIACPVALARLRLLPLVQPFLERFAEIELDLVITDRAVDLLEEGVEVAIREGDLRDTALRARRLALATRVCVASPACLARHTPPRTPADLREHDCITQAPRAEGETWPFEGAPVGVRGRLSVNSAEGVRAAVLDGIGIGLAPVWLLEDALADGRAVALLQRFRLPPLPIYASFSAKRPPSLRASAFIDFIADAADRGFVRPSSAAPRSGG